MNAYLRWIFDDLVPELIKRDLFNLRLDRTASWSFRRCEILVERIIVCIRSRRFGFGLGR